MPPTPTPIHIRPALSPDEPHIGALLIDAFLSAYRRKMPEVTLNEARFAELRSVGALRHHGLVLVAETLGDREHERGLAGTVTSLPWGAPQNESFVDGADNLRYLAVTPAWHGRGVSTLLLDACEERVKARGVKTICLHVRRGAVGVARIYTARGYQRVESGDLDLLPLVFLEGYRLDF